MMIEPQKLEYVSSDFDPPAILVRFNEYQQSTEFPVQKVIETAFNALKQSNTDSFYRKQAWDVINCYLMASTNLSDDRRTLINLFMHPSFQDANTIPHVKGSTYKSIYKQARETHQTALTGKFATNSILFCCDVNPTCSLFLKECMLPRLLKNYEKELFRLWCPLCVTTQWWLLRNNQECLLMPLSPMSRWH